MKRDGEMARILVVEDDARMRELLGEGLREEGYEVASVATGVDALIEVTQHDCDLAVVDVMLPGMDGFEVCRKIREFGSRLPIIVITARDAVEDRIAGLDSGADDYLTKPFHFAELVARIRAQLRRQSASPQENLTAADLHLDLVSVRAYVDGRPLPLSMKEFFLLKDLVVHLGEIRSRTQILEEVWGSVQTYSPTVVDQYVSYLRKKLSLNGSGIQIATERGRGYRLLFDEEL